MLGLVCFVIILFSTNETDLKSQTHWSSQMKRKILKVQGKKRRENKCNTHTKRINVITWKTLPLGYEVIALL